MKKKTISLILAAAMIFSLSSTAFASDHSLISRFDSSVPIRAQSAVQEDLTLIQRLGFDSDLLTSVSMVNGRLSYTFNIGGIESSIIPTQTETSVLYEITEGTKYDLLEIFDNGNVSLNDRPINIKLSSQTQPLRVVNDYWTSVCPYGSPGDYNEYYDHVYKANYSLEQTIGNIALGTLISLLALAIPGLAGVGVSTVAAIAIEMQNNSPLSAAISYKDFIYIHKDNGWWVVTGLDALAVKKHSIYIYDEANYGGLPHLVVSYECRKLD